MGQPVIRTSPAPASDPPPTPPFQGGSKAHPACLRPRAHAADRVGEGVTSVLLPSLEGRGRGWVGPLFERRQPRRATHPQPLPSREGSKAHPACLRPRAHAADRVGEGVTSVLLPSLEGRGRGWVSPLFERRQPRRATHPQPLPSREGSKAYAACLRPRVDADDRVGEGVTPFLLPSLERSGRGWPARYSDVASPGERSTPNPSLPGRGARRTSPSNARLSIRPQHAQLTKLPRPL